MLDILLVYNIGERNALIVNKKKKIFSKGLSLQDWQDRDS